MSPTELTALLTPVGVIISGVVSMLAMLFAHAAKQNTERNTEETKALRIEINHRMESFLALTQQAAFAAGAEDQRSNKTLK